jgi:hypothetical protein
MASRVGNDRFIHKSFTVLHSSVISSSEAI